MKKNSVLVEAEKLVFYITLFFSSIGGSMLGIKTSSMTFSIYRILVLLLLVLSIFNWRYFRDRFSGFTGFFCVLAVWIVFSLFQLVFSHDLGRSIRGLLILGSVMELLFLSSYFINSKRSLTLSLYFFLGGIIINDCFFLIEIFTGHYFNLSGSSALIASYSNSKNAFNLFYPLGFLGNQNDVAFLCFVCQGAVMLLLSLSDKSWQRIGLVIFSLVNIFIWICTGSRAAYLSICLLVFFYAVISYNRTTKQKILAIYTPLFLLACLLAYIYFSNSTDKSDQIRLSLIVDGVIILFKQSFGLGVGIGGAEYFVSQFNNTSGVTNLHFFVLELLVTGGVVVFVLFLTIYIKALMRFSHSKNSPFLWISQGSIICSSYLLVFIFASIGPSHLFDSDYLWAMFIFVSSFASLLPNSKLVVKPVKETTDYFLTSQNKLKNSFLFYGKFYKRILVQILIILLVDAIGIPVAFFFEDKVANTAKWVEATTISSGESYIISYVSSDYNYYLPASSIVKGARVDAKYETSIDYVFSKDGWTFSLSDGGYYIEQNGVYLSNDGNERSLYTSANPFLWIVSYTSEGWQISDQNYVNLFFYSASNEWRAYMKQPVGLTLFELVR